MLPVIQYQTYFAIAVDDARVDFSHQSLIERLTIERHQWLSADELERRPERLADPAMPRLMRAAVTAVAGLTRRLSTCWPAAYSLVVASSVK